MLCLIARTPFQGLKYYNSEYYDDLGLCSEPRGKNVPFLLIFPFAAMYSISRPPLVRRANLVSVHDDI